MRLGRNAPIVATVVIGALLPASGPALAQPASASREQAVEQAVLPTRVVGNGTPASCTSQAVVAAVARGGVIKFSCGSKPVTIAMKATAKVRNTSARVVIDGGGKVTLSGEGVRRILYMNTCDRSLTLTAANCTAQSTPYLSVRGITFARGNATGQQKDGGGGGAIFVRGGRFDVTNARFVGNRCDSTGPDLGGAAIRVLDPYRDGPINVVKSTFTGGICSNGGALSSIHVSWTIVDSVFTNNKAIGRGANPARRGTPGGGSGGAIYTDGDRFTVKIVRSRVEGNSAREGGGAVFFVSNDRTGTLRIERSTLRRNPSAGFETEGFPGIFFLGAGKPQVVSSTLRK
ncbi:hypothetical protein [Spongiactinospora sp. TRM90649]|uniref:hypothetical protein n=1 Tax=Spongiactinospora sp. TRM90649 TaxID=3031114 RepID=UPI0023F8EEFC|nr:hypothetical protein [Spongiactinospora sp. TRM90649]MDF5757778.1 hypothetical protein [Spongiactinospora sp. TRM90649]